MRPAKDLSHTSLKRGARVVEAALGNRPPAEKAQVLNYYVSTSRAGKKVAAMGQLKASAYAEDCMVLVKDIKQNLQRFRKKKDTAAMDLKRAVSVVTTRSLPDSKVAQLVGLNKQLVRERCCAAQHSAYRRP